ncbi:MAG: hypothetical protein O7B24_11310, partial [Alphaproteobacteria bacterium]|nr:hypothetical protein [Alphaproteobacteria bacterium]
DKINRGKNSFRLGFFLNCLTGGDEDVKWCVHKDVLDANAEKGDRLTQSKYAENILFPRPD